MPDNIIDTQNTIPIPSTGQAAYKIPFIKEADGAPPEGGNFSLEDFRMDAESYSKTEIDGKLSLKANQLQVDEKNAAQDAAIALKASQGYVDEKLAGKQSKLPIYVDSEGYLCYGE